MHPGELPDEEMVLKRAFENWRVIERLQQRRETQKLTFSHGPIALVQMADLHLGGDGVNYPRLWEETEKIVNMPATYLILGGDPADNFVIGNLRRARDDANMSVTNEMALVKMWLKLAAPKLRVILPGNHYNWLKMLTGIDYFESVVSQITDNVLYDPHEIMVDVKVGDFEQLHKVRHIWRGSSIYNDTHGVERSAKFDRAFDVGWASHTHASGLVRSFNVEGRTGWALLSGTYKQYDPFAREKGFTPPNKATAVGLLIDDKENACVGFDNLNMLDKYMRSVYANSKGPQ